MAQCAFHPEVESNIRCAECDRYMCPKDMVVTPVGYKCRECAKPARGQLAYVKPKQLVAATCTALGVGVVGGLVLGQVRPGFFIMLLFGVLVAAAVRRASGGHRGAPVAAIAAAGAVLGGLIGGVGWLSLLFSGIAAYAYLAREWGA